MQGKWLPERGESWSSCLEGGSCFFRKPQSLYPRTIGGERNKFAACFIHCLKTKWWALASLAQWIERWPANQSDANPSQQDPLWLLYSNTHGLQKSYGEKGAAWLLSKLKRGPLTPAWTCLYCFSGHITLRAILIYYAQVHHR